ncbi:PP2C family serine/threonine-protein phosphatase [Streptomyces sp. 891-h]|uniref:PP2C family serine/threonine-protein phosphatase n=1 Tax=Streptomyces sp. 891-h TaxID=2720714 RepID=UPI001FA9714E|nr:PP2C family serine/threonine-protein phosphatase [Streptomyces sp. 891-h]UNZ19305.1 serine/threonine-protein phosphatase [Streptomyces sp. 891-h]
MPQLHQLSACPSCAEPLEEGDRFCGACGADLESAAAAAAAQGRAGHGDAPPAPRTPTLPDGLPAAGPAGPGYPPPPPSPPPAAPPTAAPASAQAPTEAEPDYALPPAAEQPGTPPLPGTPAPLDVPPPPPAAPAPPEAPAPHAGPVPPEASAPTGPDPRTGTDSPTGPDPRTVLDEPGGASAAGSVQAAAGGGGMAGDSGTADEPSGPVCVACGTGTIDSDGYCEHCGHKQPRDRDHMERALDTVAAASDRGLRHHRNEDFFAIAETTTSQGTPATFAVICDGVSSATRPDEASAAAAEAASTSLCQALPQGRHPQQAMHEALVAASDAVNALAADAPVEPSKNAPACTVVGALSADGILTVGWIGDSRAYWVPDDRSAPPARLTEDDSWAAQMVAAGLMSETEAYADPRAHAITGWLGADAYEIDPHTASFKPDQPGVVVVCTDGLWNYAESAEEMAAAVPPDALTRPLQSAQHLVGYALDGGGHDNVTVAVVPFPLPPGGAGSA